MWSGKCIEGEQEWSWEVYVAHTSRSERVLISENELEGRKVTLVGEMGSLQAVFSVKVSMCFAFILPSLHYFSGL